MEDFQVYFDKGINWTIEKSPSLIAGVLILVIGFWALKRFLSFVELGMKKAKLSDDIRPFLISIIGISIKVVLILIVLNIVGIETGAFIGILAAASFAVGMALQGSLGNFAAGIIVLVFKPYRVGDWVEIHGKFGQVKAIQIFHTVVLSPGRKTLIVPNGSVIDDIITNFSTEGMIRMKLQIDIPYEEDYPKIEKILMDTISNTPHVLDEPVPEIGIKEFGSHSISISIRPYVEPANFWNVHFEGYKRIKEAFHSEGIQVAYSEGVEMGKFGK